MSPGKTWRERRAFDYYIQHAAPLIGGLDVEFWSTMVPQVCHAEPAVWDAIISISALFESYRPSNPTTKCQDALDWYLRSVSAIRHRIERGGVDVFVGLISCVLFICIEALQGGTEEALQLYCQGNHLALTLRSQISRGHVSKSTALLLEDTIVPIFSRLSIIANQQNKVAVGALIRETDCACSPRFSSIKGARDTIYVLTAETQQFQEACEHHHDSTNDFHVPPHLISRQLALLTRLESWHRCFQKLIESLPKNVSAQQKSIIGLLLTHHQMLHVINTTCISRFKITTDMCLSSFQAIVKQSQISLQASARSDGSQPPFTLDIGVGFPIWFTVLRCAEPKIRRAALALLRKSSHVQGFYTQAFGASFGEAVMVVEESLAASINTEWSADTLFSPQSIMPGYMGTAPTELAIRIPEEARIKPYGVFRPRDGLPPGIKTGDVGKWNVTPGQTFLQYSRNTCDPDTGTWRVVDEILPVNI